MGTENKSICMTVSAEAFRTYKDMRRRKMKVGKLISEFILSMEERPEGRDSKMMQYSEGYSAGHHVASLEAKPKMRRLRKELSICQKNLEAEIKNRKRLSRKTNPFCEKG